MAKPKHKVWRFQLVSDVVSAMTHDRRFALHFPLDEVWALNFHGRTTFYATAMVVGRVDQPRLRLLRETTEEDWK